MSELKWISESAALPIVGQKVFVATPRQSGEFWDINVMCLLVRHEGVVPFPVSPGSSWPTYYYWGSARHSRDTHIITGNGWWASMSGITLPPKAAHQHIRGYDCISQIGDVFIPQGARR